MEIETELTNLIIKLRFTHVKILEGKCKPPGSSYSSLFKCLMNKRILANILGVLINPGCQFS